MKAVVAAFNQEKALVGAFSVITNIRMELFEPVVVTGGGGGGVARGVVATCAAVAGPLQQTSSFPRAWFIQGCNNTFVILASLQ